MIRLKAPLKILTVIGARPQFIKAAAVSYAFSKHSGLREILLHTGQHYDANMSDIFFEELNIPKPKYNLSIGGGRHGFMTGNQLIEIEKVLLSEIPDWVLVYGDTNSTLAGALAAAKLHIPVAHIEAGLRSFNRKMPEELNRVVSDHLSTLLFAPTTTAINNLYAEGLLPEKCIQSGDVMFDASLLFGARAREHSKILNSLNIHQEEYILATIHRAENTDDLSCLTVILKSFNEVSKKIPVIWPIHPRTRKLLDQYGLHQLLNANVKLIDPVGYLDMVMLVQSAALIATDSGGIQKEAFFFQVPCVTLRGETEWIELLESGWNQLAPPNDSEVVANQIMNAIGSRGKQVTPYGNGDASEKILQKLIA